MLTVTITRRDWWFGIFFVVIVVLAHAAVPRFDWRQGPGVQMIRIDRWTGQADIGGFFDQRGWVSLAQRRAERAASEAKPIYLDDRGNPLPAK
jgi:hypothetical protein